MHKTRTLYVAFLLIFLAALPVAGKAPIPDSASNLERTGASVESPARAAIEPDLALSRNGLAFGADEGGGSHTGPQTLIVSNDGDGCLGWSATVSDSSWMTVTPLTGGDGTLVTVSVDPSGLAVGTHTGSITFTSSTAANSPVVLPVTLTMYAAGGTSAPFGEFSTPLNGSTAMGNIPVTGWALDDIEVTSVKIYRDPIAGEGSDLIYIGDAVFVEGARPDVAALFPNAPHNTRAGWGYLMLTNFLPNQGNGTFTLHAEATDSSGNSVTLGTKTIAADNANAVKPFGMIDTPTQGGVASGASFINWGWALTPQPNTIPTDGSTITVWVDDVALGHPNYNQYRSDIADLFPGYNNSDGAVGYFALDTTTYENGLHRISWSVTDDAGNTDGIGSRFFTILNDASESAPAFVVVDDDHDAATPGWGTDHFASIQAGITAVASGGVIEVAAGIYTESVSLAKEACVSFVGDVDIDGNVSVSSGNLISSRDNLQLSGNLSTAGGSFAPNDGTVTFDGTGTQTITGDTTFLDLVVGPGVTVFTAADITVEGTLTNNGVTRESKAVAGTGLLSFGLADVSVDVTTAGLAGLQVERRDQNHPSAKSGLQTGRYWSFTPTGSDFTLVMTLPHNASPTVNDKVCRYTGVGTTWDCDADGFDAGAQTITRQGITQLSDWATGDDVGATAVKMMGRAARSGLVLVVGLLLGVGGVFAAIRARAGTSVPPRIPR